MQDCKLILNDASGLYINISTKKNKKKKTLDKQTQVSIYRNEVIWGIYFFITSIEIVLV